MTARTGWRPGLVALDIDGTVVGHDGQLPSSVFDAVQKVVRAGVPVVLATGRGWMGTKTIFEALELPPGQAVTSNGSVRVTYPPLEVLTKVTFDPTDVIERVLELHPEAAVAVEMVGRGNKVNRLFPEGELTGEMVTVEVAELCAEPATRVVIRDPNASEADFFRLAERLGLQGVSYFIGWTAWLQVAPLGVDKAFALAEVCAELAIDRADVLALGDGRNDIEMLRWAGRGVALGDAVGSVRDAADHVTSGFLDDGTAEELNRWFG